MKRFGITGRPLRIVVCAVIFCIFVFTLTGCCVYMQTRSKGMEPQVRPLASKKYRVLEYSEGTSSSFNLLWFIPVTQKADFNRAFEEAVYNKNGDNLIEVTWSCERQIWIVGTVDIIYVRGKVIQHVEEK